jgi:hypothetical protein
MHGGILSSMGYESDYIKTEDARSVEKGHEQYIDDVCFERFSELYLEDYEYLSYNPEKLEQEKSRFLSREVLNPNLYNALENSESTSIDNRLRKLEQFMSEIPALTDSEMVGGAYAKKAEELMLTLDALEAKERGDDEKFLKRNKDLYSLPDSDIFALTLEELQEGIERAHRSKDALRVQSAEYLAEETLRNTLVQDHDLTELHALKAKVVEPPQGLLENNDDSLLSAEEIQSVFKAKLDELGIDSWEVCIDTQGTKRNMSVSQETKVVWIPGDDYIDKRVSPKKRPTRRNIDIIAAHEIGTHVARRENGEKTSMKLIGYGLDRIVAAEEGIATYREQMLREDDSFSGFLAYLKIGLVLGLDGKKRGFREVYDVMYHYSLMRNDRKEDRATKIERAQNLAWDSCVRTFRGTTGQTPGACHLRDVSYREGNIAIWRLVRDHPEIEPYFNVGKYDPTNRRHVRLLQQLGVIDRGVEVWGAQYDHVTDLEANNVQ